jgi:PTS system fructose-specific IIC component
MSLITEAQVVLDLVGADRHEATRTLAATLVTSGRCTDLEQFVADVATREATMATGLPGGIGIPHARSAAITEPSLAFGRIAGGLDWGAKDGPADLVFLIAAPEAGGDAHMQMLPKLARALMKKDFVAALRGATTKAEVVALVNDAVALDPAPAAAPAQAAATAPAAAPAAAATASTADRKAAPMRFVGVTSCPTGIAHTYMAAESLEAAAKAAGHSITVETQGSAGSEPLAQSVIDSADAVIFAHDLPVKDVHRFAGKPTVDVGVKRAISDGPALIAQAVAAVSNPATRSAAASAPTGGLVTKVDANASLGTQIRQWLMTGVSYMIPFVAAGGILIALGFMLATAALGKNGPVDITAYDINLPKDLEHSIMHSFNPLSLTWWAALLFRVGVAAFGFLVPALSGFIAYAIADRPGLVPGFVGGAIAGTTGAGFLGGLVTGILGGLVARWISRWKVAKGVRGIMPVVVTPLLSTLIVGGLFIIILGRPIKGLMDALTDGLNNMGGGSLAVLGLILGAMMGFDLGGPVNKVAYTFATTGLATTGLAQDATQYKIMAAVMAAGMVAPLALALATTLRPKLFTEPEQENGKAAWLLGASFISEGAIPFAAADPARIIASSVVGSAITGALCMAFGATSMAPHGGIWVALLFGNFLGFLIALAVGVAVMALIVIALKQRDHSAAAARIAA